MAIDITEVEKRINSIVAQDPTSPTAGGDDWNLYLKYINISQGEWENAYDWSTLYKEVNTLSSTSTANATLSLPGDFKKLDGFLKICDETNATHEYSQILPHEKSQYNEVDKFFYILGYPGSFSMVINPGTHGSGASIYYSYYASAASLVSPSDVSMCPDPEYLVQRSVGYLWESRDDGRFPTAKEEADRILARMLESENVKGVSYNDKVKTCEESRYGWRIGRD